MRSISGRELENVLKQDIGKRYKYFINMVVAYGVLFSLKQGNDWLLMGTDSGDELVPVWPAPEYAKLCARDEWADAEPAPIDLHAFLDRWIPGMIKDSRKVAVFPSSGYKGGVVEPERLKHHLLGELERVE